MNKPIDYVRKPLKYILMTPVLLVMWAYLAVIFFVNWVVGDALH